MGWQSLKRRIFTGKFYAVDAMAEHLLYWIVISNIEYFGGVMSWLSGFFKTLLGRNHHVTTPNAAPQQSRKPKRPPPQRPADPTTEYPNHSLGYVLKHSPPATPAMHAYDLNDPPALDKDARSRLQDCIHSIPPMPEIWHQVQAILQQDDASASDLGQCIAQDPVLTAQILKVCNSSAYAAAGSAEISNIPLAIARLGLDEASSIIFRCLAPDLGNNAQRKMEIRHIWFHAQAIAMLSRVLAEPARQVSRHDATLIGMLHDIGKLVILHIEPEQQLHRLQEKIDQGMPSLAAEHATLGYTHVDAGMMLALHWRLPKQVQRSISFHHHPAVMKADHLAQDIQHAMLTLHTAHLILQHHLQAEEQIVSTSIWQAHQRSCLHDTLRFAQQDMSISLESESLYAQIEADIKRLKLSFADLFS